MCGGGVLRVSSGGQCGEPGQKSIEREGVLGLGRDVGGMGRKDDDRSKSDGLSYSVH